MQINQNIKLAVDAVVFGYREQRLELLLIRQKFGTDKEQWALPGGFVRDEENLNQAVLRELNEETGIQVNYLEQLYSFGSVDRDPRYRVVSVAFLALINPSNYALQAGTDAEDVKWFALEELPELAFDHQDIVKKAHERLRAKINYQPIGFELLEEEFPFSALEQLYQSILQKKVDRRNFRKKLLSFGILEETDKIFKPQSGRPAKLFCFNKQRYQQLQEEGFIFEIKFV